MGVPKPSALTLHRRPNLAQPRNLFDLLNYVLSEFGGVSGSLVTRMCESDYGVTREQWQVVAMLAALGPLSPSDLAAATTVDRSQMSKTLRTAVTRGLVWRERVPGDHRRAKVGLTLGGQALYGQMFPRVTALQKQLLEGVDAGERQVLTDVLLRLQLNAQQAFFALREEGNLRPRSRSRVRRA